MKKSTVGERIRWVIEKHVGISQAELSKKLHDSKGNRGVSRQLINRWLNDPKHPPEERSLKEISQLFGVSLVWLRYGEGDPLAAGVSLDPTILHTALQDVLAIVSKALGMDPNLKNRIEENVIDVSPDIMAILSNDEQFLRAGRQWSQALGWDRKDIEGKKWEDIAHPNDIKTSRLAFTISRDQKAIVEFDGRAKNEEGEYQNIRWRITTEEDRMYIAGRETSEPPRTGLQIITRGEKEEV